MSKHKTQPWKETQPTRAVRLSDSVWEAIAKAAEEDKKTRADWLRDLVLPVLKKRGLLTITVILILFSACGRTDLLPQEGALSSRTTLFIPLGAGIRTDVEDSLLPLGKDLEVQNMQFDKTGSLVKRFGHLAQSVNIKPGASTLSQTWQLAAHKSARVSLPQSALNPLAAYSPTTTAWTLSTSDRSIPIQTALTKLASGGADPRSTTGAGYAYIVYSSFGSPLTIGFDVIDLATGHKVFGTSFIGVGTIFNYDVVFCNGVAVVVMMDNTAGLILKQFTPSTMAVVSSTPGTVAPGNTAFDVTVKNATTISVVYSDGTLHLTAADIIASSLATTAWTPTDSTATTIPADRFCAWVVDLGGSGKLALATASSPQGVRVQWDFPTSGATRQAAVTYNADPATTGVLTKITANTTDNSATGSFQVLYTTPGSSSTNNVTKMAVRTGGSLITGFVLYRSLTLASKPWTAGGNFYAAFVYPQVINNVVIGNCYVMRIPIAASQPLVAAPQAQYGIGKCSGSIGSPGNLTSFVGSSSQLIGVLGFITRIASQGDSSVAPSALGCALVTISYPQATANPTTGPAVEALDSLIVPGGAIGQYDGFNYGEMGFAYSPGQATLTPGGGGSMTANATYWYAFVFVRLDAQGRTWRSGVSIPQSVAMGANTSVAILAPTLRVTGYTNVRVEVYRGIANSEALFQKVTEILNVLTADTVSYTDTVSDTALANGEELYLGENANAILNNDTIPGSPFVFIWQNRVWFISADDPTELWFSNIISPGNGVRFNSQNIVRIADAHGQVYSAGVMDDKVIAIKGDAVYSWSGDGPDDAGNGGFSPPIIVALGVGSTNPRSVASNKDGVLFDSTSNRPGIQMIDHGLSVANAPDGSAFAGAVQAYANEQIMSAILIPEQSQVRFYCLSGRVLVYDMISKNWATFLLTLGGAHVVSAVATNGAALIALDNLAIWLEDNTGATYTDAGAIQGERLASPWIQTGGVNGFERLKEMIGAGRTIADHTLTVQQYINVDDSAPVGTKTFTETVASTPLWNWEWIPRVQRMAALKLVLSEASSGAGFKADGVSLLLGLRTGLNRQPTTTRGP